MTVLDEKCTNCKYFVPYSNFVDQGCCYYSPPSVIGTDATRFRPEVNGNDFCSKFVSKSLPVINKDKKSREAVMDAIQQKLLIALQEAYSQCVDDEERDELYTWLDENIDDTLFD